MQLICRVRGAPINQYFILLMHYIRIQWRKDTITTHATNKNHGAFIYVQYMENFMIRDIHNAHLHATPLQCQRCPSPHTPLTGYLKASVTNMVCNPIFLLRFIT